MNAAAPHYPPAVTAVGTFWEGDVFVLIFHTARRIYSNKIEPNSIEPNRYLFPILKSWNRILLLHMLLLSGMCGECILKEESLN